MNTAFGAALLVLGVVLLVMGFNESQSLGSDVSRIFTGSPTEGSMWKVGVGIFCAVFGLVLLLVRGKRRG